MRINAFHKAKAIFWIKKILLYITKAIKIFKHGFCFLIQNAAVVTIYSTKVMVTPDQFQR